VVRFTGQREGGVALSVGCNSRWCYLDPRLGAAHAVAETARNVSCVGGEPLAVTDCLNFGNPERPEIMWQFEQACLGIADACAALGTPVVSGNVSLYNETEGKAVYPTPMIGMVGAMDDCAKNAGSGFVAAGDRIAIVWAGASTCSPSTARWQERRRRSIWPARRRCRRRSAKACAPA
jgi:phosphoribosylformylglycinamidine synthase